MEDVDFKLYLDAVNTSTQRTRSTIYALIIAVLLLATAFRNTTTPDWMNSRLAKLQQASACLEDNDRERPECKDSIDYATDFVFTGKPPVGPHPDNEPFYMRELRTELKEQINALIKQRTEFLTVHLPFFGVAIDMNDLELVGGWLLVAIVIVLSSGLGRDLDNLERARSRAGQKSTGGNNYKGNLELLLMGRGVGQALYWLIGFVLAVQLYSCIDDTGTLPASVVLQGKSRAWVDMIAEWAAFLLCAIFSSLCVYRERRLNQLYNGLIQSIRRPECAEERRP
jgi:hypothetical protein